MNFDDYFVFVCLLWWFVQNCVIPFLQVLCDEHTRQVQSYYSRFEKEERALCDFFKCLCRSAPSSSTLLVRPARQFIPAPLRTTIGSWPLYRLACFGVGPPQWPRSSPSHHSSMDHFFHIVEPIYKEFTLEFCTTPPTTRLVLLHFDLVASYDTWVYQILELLWAYTQRSLWPLRTFSTFTVIFTTHPPTVGGIWRWVRFPMMRVTPRRFLSL